MIRCIETPTATWIYECSFCYKWLEVRDHISKIVREDKVKEFEQEHSECKEEENE